MIVLDWKLTLTASDTMRHFSRDFNIDYPRASLKIFYEYHPKIYENKEASLAIVNECYARYGAEAKDAISELPLNNLITISLDSPEGRVGGAHRHLNKSEYIIKEDYASEGFLPVPISKGLWTIILSAHCILSESVEISVRAEVYD